MLLRLVRASLWSTPLKMQGHVWTHEQYAHVMSLAREQALAGLVSQALMDSGIRLERQDALELFALQQRIRKRNALMNNAVVKLCQKMKERGIRIFVMKGQTLAAHYPDAGLRQSGDIDFLCYPDDWDKAIDFFCNELKLPVTDNTTEKHVSFQIGGVEYELHRQLAAFASPRHRRYWEEYVVPEMWASVSAVTIDGYDVPTLSPLYNVLYVFVHSFAHLLDEGVGLRQFCDNAVLLAQQVNRPDGNDEFDVQLLEKHLEGLGLRQAFTGFGAILTDYLGFPEKSFPFIITDEDHRRAPKLLMNMFELGNFGHNKRYIQESGILHGIEHLSRITLQARRFYHYAPSEAWWRIPYMFKWWGIKIKRLFSGEAKG